MTVRSSALGRIITPSGTNYSPVFTVQTGETWLLKSVEALSLAAADSQVILIGSQPSTGVQVRLFNGLLANTAVIHWAGWMVFEPGDQLLVYATQAGIHVWASGTQLVGVAT